MLARTRLHPTTLCSVAFDQHRHECNIAPPLLCSCVEENCKLCATHFSKACLVAAEKRMTMHKTWCLLRAMAAELHSQVSGSDVTMALDRGGRAFLEQSYQQYIRSELQKHRNQVSLSSSCHLHGCCAVLASPCATLHMLERVYKQALAASIGYLHIDPIELFYLFLSVLDKTIAYLLVFSAFHLGCLPLKEYAAVESIISMPVLRQHLNTNM